MRYSYFSRISGNINPTTAIFEILPTHLLHSLLLASEMSARSRSKGETVHGSLPITEILFIGSKILLFPNVRVLPV